MPLLGLDPTDAGGRTGFVFTEPGPCPPLPSPSWSSWLTGTQNLIQEDMEGMGLGKVKGEGLQGGVRCAVRWGEFCLCLQEAWVWP